MSRTLIICHKQLGDVLLLEPSVAKIRDAVGGQVEILTRSGHGPLIELMPGLSMAGRTWLRDYDAVFCFDADRKSVIYAALTVSRTKHAVLRDSSELTAIAGRVFQNIRAPGLGDTYVARYNWENTVADSELPFRPPVLKQPPDAWRPAGFEATDYLLLNPTAGWKRKRWKTSAWRDTLDGLTGVPRIVITSGDQGWQIEQAQHIADHLGERAMFLGGKTRLEEFLWLVANARMVLGVDGAASHLAAAFDVPNVTLFLTTNAKNWHWPAQHSIALVAETPFEGAKPEIETDAVAALATHLWASAT